MRKFLAVALCLAATQAMADHALQDGKKQRNAVSDASPIYGSCWGCMHGCTWQENISICGIDPRRDSAKPQPQSDR